MDLAHEFSKRVTGISFIEVSILVLVDLAREYEHMKEELADVVSFNPCFSGSCSRICGRRAPGPR